MKFKIFRFKEVESTNNTAIRIIKSKKVNNGMVISEFQKKHTRPGIGSSHRTSSGRTRGTPQPKFLTNFELPKRNFVSI